MIEPSAHGRPTATDLIVAVREFLDADVRDATTGQVNFHARVASNVLRIVERELARGRADDDAYRAELESLGQADEAGLASAIRAGDLDDRLTEVTEVVRGMVRRRLDVAHPGYAAGSPE
jgi:hypothetical protein